MVEWRGNGKVAWGHNQHAARVIKTLVANVLIFAYIFLIFDFQVSWVLAPLLGYSRTARVVATSFRP